MTDAVERFLAGLPDLERGAAVRRIRAWEEELAAIEARAYRDPLDHTRAAVARSCIRREEATL